MLSELCEKLVRRKLIDRKSLESSKLDRCLTTLDLTALGVGATLGVGIYVLSGSVAKEVAGPSVVLSFLIAGVASALSGMCYAELGSRVPKAGSAYVYSYVTVGEFVGFIIGWNLILEYVIGTASVARGYSGYLDNLLNKTMQKTLLEWAPLNLPHLSPYPDLCSFGITLVLTCILCCGVKESTRFNNIFTCLNMVVVVVVTFSGLLKSNTDNWFIPETSIPADANGGHGGFFPFGISGTLAGAATCFFGYVGFDSIATSGEETRNPQRSIPISICLSLFIVFLSYFGISSTLTLMVPYYLQDADAPLPAAFKLVGWNFIGNLVSIGALFGLSTSLLGAMFPLPRILYAMSSDGLIFRWLSHINGTFQTPIRATLLSGILAGLMAAMFDLKSLVDMMSIGTLMAYTIVSASVILLRYQNVPGLDNDNGYIALGTLSEEAQVFQHDETDSEDEEIVYCRKSDMDDLPLKNLKLSSKVSISFSELVNGFLNLDKAEVPTAVSSYTASILTVTYSVLSVLLAFLVNHVDLSYNGLSTILVEISIGVLVFFMTLCLTFLAFQPRTTQNLYFKVPLVPWIPGLSIFVNVYLMMKLSLSTWVRFLVWMTLGFTIYFTYGIRNSSEEYKRRGRKPPEL